MIIELVKSGVGSKAVTEEDPVLVVHPNVVTSLF